MYENMPYPGDMTPDGPYSHWHPHEQHILVIQDCEAVCEHMTHYVTMRPDVQSRRTQLRLLRDCADICSLTVKYIARMSQFARMTANLCADICEACGHECMRFTDPQSQNCAEVCLNCAEECRIFAEM